MPAPWRWLLLLCACAVSYSRCERPTLGDAGGRRGLYQRQKRGRAQSLILQWNSDPKVRPKSGKARIVTLRDHGSGRNCAGSYEEGVAPLTRGCSAQSWDANSSESCAWKFRVIWSSVLPIGGPEGLNIQAHSEQPHPITLSSLIHTVLRDELSWPGAGTQHLTSGQRKVWHATLPNRTKARLASLQ